MSKPQRLSVLKSTKHKGHLEIVERRPGGWLVKYNVETPSGTMIYDHAVVTTAQIKKWTGKVPT